MKEHIQLLLQALKMRPASDFEKVVAPTCNKWHHLYLYSEDKYLVMVFNDHPLHSDRCSLMELSPRHYQEESLGYCWMNKDGSIFTNLGPNSGDGLNVVGFRKL